jgi:hypothetical protein
MNTNSVVNAPGKTLILNKIYGLVYLVHAVIL